MAAFEAQSAAVQRDCRAALLAALADALRGLRPTRDRRSLDDITSESSRRRREGGPYSKELIDPLTTLSLLYLEEKASHVPGDRRCTSRRCKSCERTTVCERSSRRHCFGSEFAARKTAATSRRRGSSSRHCRRWHAGNIRRLGRARRSSTRSATSAWTSLSGTSRRISAAARARLLLLSAASSLADRCRKRSRTALAGRRTSRNKRCSPMRSAIYCARSTCCYASSGYSQTNELAHARTQACSRAAMSMAAVDRYRCT